MRLAPVLLGLAAAPMAVSGAAAHAILMESQPAAGSTVAPGAAHIVLRYNSRIDQGLSRLELRDAGQPAGQKPVVLTLLPSADDRLVADLPLAPGTWVLRWQVLAVDGHITRGDVPFTVDARGQATASATAR